MNGKNFFELLAEKGFTVEKPAAVPVVVNGVTAVAGDPQGRRYAEAALNRECAIVAGTVEGSRQTQLNTSAFKIGTLVQAGHLDAQTAADALSAAARLTGLPVDEIRRTVPRAISNASKSPRVVQLQPLNGYQPAATIAAETVTTDITERLPRVDWEQLWADDSEEQWILEPIIAVGRAVVIYSAPKVGKSLLMLEIAAGIAAGRKVLGEQPTQQRVLYVDFENDPRGDIRARLQAMGYSWKDLDNLVVLSYPVLAALDTEAGGLELLAAAAHYRCTVVIIDTLSRAVDGEENSNDTYLQFYRHTVLKCKQAGLSMVRLDHSGKDAERGMRGASAKESDVDAVWRLSRIDDLQLQLDCTHHRMPVPDKELTLLRLPLPHLHHDVDQSGRNVAYEGKIAELLAALDKLKVPLDAGVRPCREALRATGLSAGNAVLREAVRRRHGSISIWDQSSGAAG